MGARVPREAGDITTGSWASERDLEDQIATVEIAADGGANQHRLTAAMERAGSGRGRRRHGGGRGIANGAGRVLVCGVGERG